jgi:Tol biopolymer transport system component
MKCGIGRDSAKLIGALAAAAAFTLGILSFAPMAAVGATTGTTTRVSVATNGGQGYGECFGPPEISADGRYVVFASSSSNLVAFDSNGCADIFVRDRLTKTTIRVSVAGSNTQANGSSQGPLAISADGRYVVFCSQATNLVAGDTSGHADVFVRDCVAKTTTRVSIATDGSEGDDHSGSRGIAISADGRYVAFDSDASNLVTGDTNGCSDIFVRDRGTSTTTRVSLASDGSQANDGCSGVSISADGRYVAFASTASNLRYGDANGTFDIFVRDRVDHTTACASVSDVSGDIGNDISSNPVISADGRYVAFSSNADNLVNDDDNGMTDTFLRDLKTTGIVTGTHLVSVATDVSQLRGAQGNAVSGTLGISISADGRYVAFNSNASNLVDGDTNSSPDAFVRDTTANTTARVSLSNSGVQGNLGSDAAGQATPRGPSISDDGRNVAFISRSSNLVPSDTNNVADIFVRDTRPVQVTEIAGQDRYATSIAASRATFATGKCDSVIIATGRNYPDALSAAGLAGVAQCPIIVVDGSAVSANATTKAEIKRLTQGKASFTVYIAGGTGAVSTGVENSLKSALVGETIVRLAGATRYDTANAIGVRTRALMTAKGIASGYDGTAIAVTGEDYHDALLVGPIAYRARVPVLLVKPSMSAAQLTALKTTMTTIGVKDVRIVGSTASVPTAIGTTMAVHLGSQDHVTRPCAASDPYAQSVAVANWAVSSWSFPWTGVKGFSWSGVGVTTGENYPDGFGAVALQGTEGYPLLFSPATSVNTTVKNAIAAHPFQVSLLRYFGGTGAVTQAVRNSLRSALP